MTTLTVPLPARTPAAPPVAARTRQLLEGPIAPTLLALAGPNVVVMVTQAAVNAGEVLYVGWLGTDALAGVSLVFPLIMLMQTMSGGGMGGGVASAIARALGARRPRDADALLVHAIVIAVGMGAAFTVTALVAGPAAYRAMGGDGPSLAAATAYSTVVFSGATAAWLFNTLASVLRGTGNMALPAMTVVGGALVVLSLSPALILGLGPFPRLGVMGAGVAVVAYYTVGSLVLLGYLAAGRGLVRFSRAALVPRRRLFEDILRVGAPGSLNTLQTNLTVVMLTALVGPFGTAALAGYGMAARLEYLEIPLVFGLGSALVTMVGTNVGAGQHARARRVAWTGAAMAAALTTAIGVGAALAPHVWLGLFTTDADVLALGAAYLHVVGPVYGFFGLGLALYFASQGAGRLLWPLLAGTSRLAVAAVGGWIAIRWLHGGLASLFVVITLAFIVFGSVTGLAIAAGGWGDRSR